MTGSSSPQNLYRIAHQFGLQGLSAQAAARFSRWWMGVNYQNTAIAYSPSTNEVRIAMLIEASTPEEAIQEAANQFSLLKEDLGDEAPEVPAPMNEWPDWAEQMIQPLLYMRQHGTPPPGYLQSTQGPPDLSR
jgi:hypothetical protein